MPSPAYPLPEYNHRTIGFNSRRAFLKQSVAAAGGLCLASLVAGAVEKLSACSPAGAPVHILLRSGWQVENIGDMAHTPSMLALCKQYIPDAIISFWPFYAYLPEAEIAMLKKHFPKLNIVQGVLDAQGKASTPELDTAIASAGFLLHNSGPATLAWADLTTFKKVWGKPFGVYGVTYGLYGVPEKEILNEAAFVYFRDSISLQKAKDAGLKASVTGFAPDVVFAIDIKDDTAATAYLKANGLKKETFLCCIPKQRNTPVWLHTHKNRPLDEARNARNELMKEHDHILMREAITQIVRTTKMKVLICHEDETEMPIGKEWIYDRLPEDVKQGVVWMNQPWLPDEAVSIYAQSAGLFSYEMHSPIMCISQGVPAIVCRLQEQSTKGIMWKDIGLGEWLFDFDNEEEIKQFVPAVLEMARHPKVAKEKAVKAKMFVAARFAETMKEVDKASQLTE